MNKIIFILLFLFVISCTRKSEENKSGISLKVENDKNELIKSSSIYKQKNTNYCGKFLEKPLFLSEYLNLSEILNKGLTNNIEKDLINLANVTEDDKEYDSILKLILRFQYKYPNICLRLTDELLSNTNIGPANLVLISNTKANILYSQGEVEKAYKITSELLDGCYSNYAIDQATPFYCVEYARDKDIREQRKIQFYNIEKARIKKGKGNKENYGCISCQMAYEYISNNEGKKAEEIVNEALKYITPETSWYNSLTNLKNQINNNLRR